MDKYTWHVTFYVQHPEGFRTQHARFVQAESITLAMAEALSEPLELGQRVVSVAAREVI